MMDRRHVLQAGAVTALGLLALPGCGSDDEPAQTVPPPTPDPQQADELDLIAAYDAALADAGPAARALYQRIRDEHAAHLRALGWLVTPSVTPAATSPPTRPELRRAEAVAARRSGDAAVADDDPERAQILALIAASEAQHVVALEAL